MSGEYPPTASRQDLRAYQRELRSHGEIPVFPLVIPPFSWYLDDSFNPFCKLAIPSSMTGGFSWIGFQSLIIRAVA
jgi:hypothetical protein